MLALHCFLALLLVQFVRTSHSLPLPSSSFLDRRASKVVCRLKLRSTYAKKCEVLNRGNKHAYRFEFKSGPFKIGKIPGKTGFHCDHTLEINQLQDLIEAGAKEMGMESSMDSFCAKLFPAPSATVKIPAKAKIAAPVPASATEQKSAAAQASASTDSAEDLSEQIRSVMERDANLYYLPERVNWMKQKILRVQTTSGTDTSDEEMYAAAVVLKERKTDILETAKMLIKVLEAAPYPPPSTESAILSSISRSDLAATSASTAVPTPVALHRRASASGTTLDAQTQASAAKSTRHPFNKDVTKKWYKDMEENLVNVIKNNIGKHTPTAVDPTTEKCVKRKVSKLTEEQKEEKYDSTYVDGNMPKKPSSRKGKTKRDDVQEQTAAQECPDDEATSSSLRATSSASITSSLGVNSTRLASTVSSARTTATRSTRSLTDGEPSLRTSATATLLHHITSSASLVKSTESQAASLPLATPTGASYASPTSRLLVSQPTRIAALPAQNAKPTPAAAASPALGSSAPTRAKSPLGRLAPPNAAGSGARIPTTPAVQQQAPTAKHPVAALPLRGSGSSKPAKAPARPLIIRRSLD